MTKFSSPTTRAGSGVAKNLKGGYNFHIFPQRLSFGRTKSKLIKKQEKLWGVRGHASRENF